MRVEELDYHLPADLIATRPAQPRDEARMMVVSRAGEIVEHARVRDLPRFLRQDDLLVRNDTAVCAARLVGRRLDTGGRVEGLYLETIEDAAPGMPVWRALLKSNGTLRPGQRVGLIDARGGMTAIVLTLLAREGEAWRLECSSAESAALVLEGAGWTPLPPYILRARMAGEQGDEARAFDDESDRAWYQTMFADSAKRRSVAAPTAGLHFTPALDAALAARSVRAAHVTLHVGAGTFQPIKSATIEAHPMHHEWFEASAATIRAIDETRKRRGRVIAVGTTTVRALESIPDTAAARGRDHAGTTDLLITPPYEFRRVDGLLTNFHLPRSTLLALVGAFIGLPALRRLYETAVEARYCFYSYGDAMLLLPD